jgi:hypothetical protein
MAKVMPDLSQVFLSVSMYAGGATSSPMMFAARIKGCEQLLGWEVKLIYDVHLLDLSVRMGSKA